MDAKLRQVTPEPSSRSSDALAAVNLSLIDDSGAKLVDRVSIEIKPGETVAHRRLGGQAAREALAEAFARLIWPDRGRVTAGNPTSSNCRKPSPAGACPMPRPTPHLFQGTLRDNLLYGLKHAPLTRGRV